MAWKRRRRAGLMQPHDMPWPKMMEPTAEEPGTETERIVRDSEQISDRVAVATPALRSATDNCSARDRVSVVREARADAADLLRVSEEARSELSSARALPDTLAGADSVVLARSRNAAAGDVVAVSDAVTPSLIGVIDVSLKCYYCTKPAVTAQLLGLVTIRVCADHKLL